MGLKTVLICLYFCSGIVYNEVQSNELQPSSNHTSEQSRSLTPHHNLMKFVGKFLHHINSTYLKDVNISSLTHSSFVKQTGWTVVYESLRNFWEEWYIYNSQQCFSTEKQLRTVVQQFLEIWFKKQEGKSIWGFIRDKRESLLQNVLKYWNSWYSTHMQGFSEDKEKTLTNIRKFWNDIYDYLGLEIRKGELNSFSNVQLEWKEWYLRRQQQKTQEGRKSLDYQMKQMFADFWKQWYRTSGDRFTDSRDDFYNTIQKFWEKWFSENKCSFLENKTDAATALQVFLNELYRNQKELANKEESQVNLCLVESMLVSWKEFHTIHNQETIISTDNILRILESFWNEFYRTRDTDIKIGRDEMFNNIRDFWDVWFRANKEKISENEMQIVNVVQIFWDDWFKDFSQHYYSRKDKILETIKTFFTIWYDKNNAKYSIGNREQLQQSLEQFWNKWYIYQSSKMLQTDSSEFMETLDKFWHDWFTNNQDKFSGLSENVYDIINENWTEWYDKNKNQLIFTTSSTLEEFQKLLNEIRNNEMSENTNILEPDTDQNPSKPTQPENPDISVDEGPGIRIEPHQLLYNAVFDGLIQGKFSIIINPCNPSLPELNFVTGGKLSVDYCQTQQNPQVTNANGPNQVQFPIAINSCSPSRNVNKFVSEVIKFLSSYETHQKVTANTKVDGLDQNEITLNTDIFNPFSTGNTMIREGHTTIGHYGTQQVSQNTNSIYTGMVPINTNILTPSQIGNTLVSGTHNTATHQITQQGGSHGLHGVYFNQGKLNSGTNIFNPSQTGNSVLIGGHKTDGQFGTQNKVIYNVGHNSGSTSGLFSLSQIGNQVDGSSKGKGFRPSFSIADGGSTNSQHVAGSKYLSSLVSNDLKGLSSVSSGTSKGTSNQLTGSSSYSQQPNTALGRHSFQENGISNNNNYKEMNFGGSKFSSTSNSQFSSSKTSSTSGSVQHVLHSTGTKVSNLGSLLNSRHQTGYQFSNSGKDSSSGISNDAFKQILNSKIIGLNESGKSLLEELRKHKSFIQNNYNVVIGNNTEEEDIGAIQKLASKEPASLTGSSCDGECKSVHDLLKRIKRYHKHIGSTYNTEN